MTTSVARCRVFAHPICVAWSLTALSFSSTPAQELLWQSAGSRPAEQFGHEVRRFADLDDDGVVDFLVTAPESSAHSDLPGTVHALSGSSAATLYSIHRSKHHDRFGESLVLLDDIDGDGVPEFAVGSPLGIVGGRALGEVTVHSGSDGKRRAGIPGDRAASRIGRSLAVLGDVDGDGLRDFVAGAPGTPFAQGGSALVISGDGRRVLHTLHGDTNSDDFGFSVAAIGDVDGDGIDDIAVGDPADFANGAFAGTVWVFSSASGAVLDRLHGEPDDFFGYALDSLSDLDADGLVDLVVGAPQFGSGRSRGELRFYSAKTRTLLRRVKGHVNERLGIVVRAVGDVDGDGVDDVAAAAMDRERVVSGATGSTLAVLAMDDNDPPAHFSAIGDFDGDGRLDFTRGVPGANQGSDFDVGRAEVLGGDDLYLWAYPASVRQDDLVEWALRAGAPRAPSALFLESIDGVSVWQPLWIGVLDASGEFERTLTVPQGLEGTFVVRAFSVENQALTESVSVTIEVHGT